MKNKYLLSLMVAGLSFGLFAQNSIQLNIEHYLHHEPLVFNQMNYTEEAVEFNVERMEYYISEIELIHDGGQSTMIPDSWVLVNAEENTEINLGSHSIDSVEAVAFSVGVDSAHNHLDPAQWPTGHPLALKVPSMHWGWAGGYRYMAMEGECGDNLGFNYELHGLGTENYFRITVDASGKAEAGSIDLTIYGNYAMVLKDLDISNGLISHGPIHEAKVSLENTRDYVFSASIPDTLVLDTTSNDSTTSIAERYINNNVRLISNPNHDQSIELMIVDGSAFNAQIDVVDLGGSLVRSRQMNGSENQIRFDNLESGLYFIRMEVKGSEDVVIMKAMVL